VLRRNRGIPIQRPAVDRGHAASRGDRGPGDAPAVRRHRRPGAARTSRRHRGGSDRPRILRLSEQQRPTQPTPRALIDGGSEPRILGRIYLPLSGGALINSAILLFLAQWTSYLWPLLITSSSNLLVVPLALAKTYSEHSFNFGENFAGSVLLSLIPALLLFVLQRFFALSVAASGNK